MSRINAYSQHRSSVSRSFWVVVAFALAEYKEAMLSNGQPEPVKLTKRGDQFVADVFPKG